MEPLVLIPGMMCDARLFGPQIAAFSGQRNLHLVSLAHEETIEDIAGAFLRAAPLRFALAGLSMGGIVAMEIMAQAPERVTRLALMDTNPRSESENVAAGREPQIARALDGGLKAVMRDEMKPRYLADTPKRDEILDLCMEMALGLGEDVFARQSRALRDRPDQQETLRGVKVPTLILYGEVDILCPAHRHDLMHDLIPGSVLRVIEGAGHLPTLEQPAATNAALSEWLEA